MKLVKDMFDIIIWVVCAIMLAILVMLASAWMRGF